MYMSDTHEVKFVGDDALPAGHDWAMVEVDDEVVFVAKRSALPSERVLAEAWAGYRLLAKRRAA